MRTIQLNNGVEMPALGFGTFRLAGEECENAVAEAIRTGYRMIDTAEAYGNEEAVGAGIKASGVERKELFLVTKVNFKSYEKTRETVLASLEKLRTDHLDLVLLHWPFANYYAAWRELEKLYEEGKIRAIGVSNFEPDRLIDLIAYNKVVPAVDQIETHLFCQRKEERVWMDKYNVRHMAYAPLGQGRRNDMYDLPEVKALAEKYGKTPAQVLLRHSVQRDVIVIPRSKSADHIAENFAVFDFELSPEDMDTLSALDEAAPMIGTAGTPEKVEMAMTW